MQLLILHLIVCLLCLINIGCRGFIAFSSTCSCKFQRQSRKVFGDESLVVTNFSGGHF
jgi:hypothetical protein